MPAYNQEVQEPASVQISAQSASPSQPLQWDGESYFDISLLHMFLNKLMSHIIGEPIFNELSIKHPAAYVSSFFPPISVSTLSTTLVLLVRAYPMRLPPKEALVAGGLAVAAPFITNTLFALSMETFVDFGV